MTEIQPPNEAQPPGLEQPAASGLPTPAELMGYENCLPGTAARLIRMAESEQEHRHKIEADAVVLSKRGQVFALVIALAFLVVSGALIWTGHEVSGTIIGSIDLVALVAVFITGRVSGSGESK